MKDKHFDGHESRFAHNIYQTNKGKLRLELLKKQLLTSYPKLASNKSLKVLDVGGGLGHMTSWLLELGHNVCFVEPAEKLVQQVESEQSEAIAMGQLQTFHQDIQSFQTSCEYDVIICHAVIEWMTDHHSLLQLLKDLLTRDGFISLAFYNQHSIHIANAIKGNLRKLAKNQIAGDGTGLTPINPPKTQDIDALLKQLGIEVGDKYGVRVLHDYMWKKSRDKISYKDLLDMELRYMAEAPYRDMGRYCHWLLTK